MRGSPALGGTRQLNVHEYVRLPQSPCTMKQTASAIITVAFASTIPMFTGLQEHSL